MFTSNKPNKYDPSTPIFYKKVNEPVVANVFMPGDKSRATSFNIHNSLAYQDSGYLNSAIKSTIPAITCGTTFERKPINYSSFIQEEVGDYMYQSAHIYWDLEKGMWGIIRVEPDDGSESDKPGDKANENEDGNHNNEHKWLIIEIRKE